MARGTNCTTAQIEQRTPPAAPDYLQWFLEDVTNLNLLGESAFHAWPQLTKLDVLPAGQRFDFLGRIEYFEDDFNELMQLLHTAKVEWANMPTHSISGPIKASRCGIELNMSLNTIRQLPEKHKVLLSGLLANDEACFLD